MFNSSLHAEAPLAGEVWLSVPTGNYFRIDGIDGNRVSVTRLGRTENGEDVRCKKASEEYNWPIETFKTGLRRVARESAKFEAFLAKQG